MDFKNKRGVTSHTPFIYLKVIVGYLEPSS